MKKLTTNVIGIDQGDMVMFSDFQDGGEMWTGTGPRERRRRVTFDEPFREVPSVHCALSMWDMDNGSNLRGDLETENIGRDGFDAVFKTWGDTRIARARIRWIAIGPVRGEGDWDV
ncbi:H-type lectin domain-containing protein [Pseudooceanicola marinus]|uniref:H-type lectin domain-containing protein n=1 Tax=Pseudooceanicola marinus TaxID=396013 RepID=UPI001C94B346|nr:H-type lectin domain-containing protein [Pseudooceanicola marinus]MBY5974409.1 H-type lectin domain-containing protein [Ferrimonas balearica]MCA1336507.1 H-type lectin domain-containing protein [Pseudooceanicola marinus]